MERNTLRRMPNTAQSAARPFVYRSADRDHSSPHPLRRANDAREMTNVPPAPQPLFVGSGAQAVLLTFRACLKVY
jgi:hypothetical protein